MELHLSQTHIEKLNRVASQQGIDPESLALDVVARFLDYEDWFLSEVNKGLLQIDRGDVIDHEEVRSRMERLLVEKRSRTV